MANDPPAHIVMAVLDTAIHALLFKNHHRDELQQRLIGFIIYK
jgi:hypothetical protein